MTYPANLSVLALDIATVTGWCRLSQGVLTSGSRDFRRSLHGAGSRGPDHVGASHAMFLNWLDGVCPDQFVYEDAGFFKSAAAVQICVGFRGILLAHAARLNVPVFSYAPMTIKKFWTGKGTAQKDDMMRVSRQRFPDLTVCDNNEADAIALLHLHLARTQGIESDVLLTA